MDNPRAILAALALLLLAMVALQYMGVASCNGDAQCIRATNQPE